MTLNSLYKFFRAYFNYPASNNVSYARAVASTMKVARETMEQKNISSIQKYMHYTYASSLTKDMLHRLIYMAMKHYLDPFKEIQYFKTEIVIDRILLCTKHRGIKIPFECGFDSKNGRLIILTFGPPKNMKNEVKVIKGLLKEFPVTEDLPDNIKTIAYWDLSSGKQAEIVYPPLLPVDRKSLIDAANRI